MRGSVVSLSCVLALAAGSCRSSPRPRRSPTRRSAAAAARRAPCRALRAAAAVTAQQPPAPDPLAAGRAAQRPGPGRAGAGPEAGEELFSRRADQPRPIASISKLAATLTVVDRGLDLDADTTITRSDADVARGGARSRLLEGMTLTNRDLLHAALLGSDNRAVSALGRAVGLHAPAAGRGDDDEGARAGPARAPASSSPPACRPRTSPPRARRSPCCAPRWTTPCSGPSPGRSSTTRTRWAAAPIHYVNTHRPAARANTVVLGGKTGFNNAARYCLVLAAKVDGRTLGMAFLGTEGKLTRFGDVARVADWVVARRARLTPVAADPPRWRPTLFPPRRAGSRGPRDRPGGDADPAPVGATVADAAPAPPIARPAARSRPSSPSPPRGAHAGRIAYIRPGHRAARASICASRHMEAREFPREDVCPAPGGLDDWLR